MGYNSVRFVVGIFVIMSYCIYISVKSYARHQVFFGSEFVWVSLMIWQNAQNICHEFKFQISEKCFYWLRKNNPSAIQGGIVVTGREL